jgi:hypothetical protein
MSPLRRRMVDDMQIRNLSPQTQGSYVRQVAQSPAILANHRSISVQPRSEPGRFTWPRTKV